MQMILRLTEGETLEKRLSLRQVDLSFALMIGQKKTAALFELASFSAAYLAKLDEKFITAASEFGRYLGIAFQVVDDILDYTGDAEVMGKNLGDDLREGKSTLPLISAMQRGSDSERATVKQAIETGDPSLLAEVVDIVKRSGALDVARQSARLEAARAVAAARRLPDTPYATCLIELASDLLERQA